MSTSHETQGWKLGMRACLTAAVTATAVGVLVLGLYPGARAAQTAGSGNAQNGKTLYASKNCSQCHGASAEGTATAPALTTNLTTFARFLNQLRKPADVMPAVAESVVSDTQAADIFAFVGSLKSSPAAATPAAAGGNLENGKRIYVAYGCWECHGYAAQGGTGPRLGPRPIPLANMIRELRHPNQMPPYTEKVVSDAEVADIRAFLESMPEPPSPDSIAILSK